MLLLNNKFKQDIQDIGFIINPYDMCVVNRNIRDTQHTVVWHIDDIKLSHLDSKVNYKFLKWPTKKYGEDGIGKVKSTRGNEH